MRRRVKQNVEPHTLFPIYITSSAEVTVNGKNKASFNTALQSNSDYRIFTLYARHPNILSR